MEVREEIDISVCIANWNCRELLHACLESLHHQPQGVRVETIVADNASTDGSPDMVEGEFPQVMLHRNSTNAGFALRQQSSRTTVRGRYLLFLNNDTVVPSGALRRLVDYADAHPEVGMVGPRLAPCRGETPGFVPATSHREHAVAPHQFATLDGIAARCLLPLSAAAF